MFAGDDAFEAARLELETDLPRLDVLRGRLGQSAAELAQALDTAAGAYKRLTLLRCYASLRSDTDTRDARYQAMRQQVDHLATRVAERVAWIRPEILALEPESVESFIAAEPKRRGGGANPRRDRLARPRAVVALQRAAQRRDAAPRSHAFQR
jgi:oligoendopeptidase F